MQRIRGRQKLEMVKRKFLRERMQIRERQGRVKEIKDKDRRELQVREEKSEK
jgi:hypothetical protein